MSDTPALRVFISYSHDSRGHADRVAALEGDIANIREFVILLRRDQVALRDSVSALEASDSQQAADIADRAVTRAGEQPRFDLDRTIDRFVTSRWLGFPIMLLMLTVGTGVRVEQLGQVLRLPRVLIGVTVAQALVLPLDETEERVEDAGLAIQ